MQKYFKLIEDPPLRLVGHNVLILESDPHHYVILAEMGGGRLHQVSQNGGCFLYQLIEDLNLLDVDLYFATVVRI